MMKCKEIENKIWIYHELSELDQRKLKEHCESCSSCRAQLEIHEEWSRLIEGVKSLEIEPIDKDRLTDKIISAIQERRSETIKQVQWSPFLILRAAMTMISVTLIITFMMEYNTGEYETETISNEPGLTAKLYTRGPDTLLVKQSRKKYSIYALIKK